MMRKLLRRAALTVCTAFALASGPTHAATDPVATINDFYATLLQTMKRGSELGGKGRYDALSPVIRRSFDLATMAQMVTGPTWATLSPADRREVTEALSRYTIATYADRFSGYAGEKLEVTDQRNMPYGTIVDSRIVKANGDPVSIDYLMRQNGQQWQIADVYFQGTVSQLTTMRSQFGKVAQRGGAKELIDTLNHETASMVPNSGLPE